MPRAVGSSDDLIGLLDRAPDRPDADWDQAMVAGVRGLDAAGVRARMTVDRSWALVGWARDCASEAVRREDPERVLLGLVALSLFGHRFDPREALLIYPLLGRAAEKLGRDRAALFLEAATRSDAEGERWLTDLSRSEASPESMGFAEDETGGRFTFRNTEAGWDPDAELADL